MDQPERASKGYNPGRMKKLLFAAVIFGSAIALISCGKPKLFEQYQKFDYQSWNRFNILKFDVPVNDTIHEFDVILAIRHLPEFQVKGFNLNMTIYMPSGEMRTANHENIYYDKEGNRLSECLGDLCDISILLRKDFIFPERGIIRFEIENKYPKIELPGILEVGLIVKRSKS
jgi:gliding motility-associated lipoprotein GldH